MTNNIGKIQRLTVKGFKSLRDVEALELRDLNIVIGSNGAGKSNFIGLFRFLAYLAREELQTYVTMQGGLNKILHFGPQTTKMLEVGFVTPSDNFAAALRPTNEGGLAFATESQNTTRLKDIANPSHQGPWIDHTDRIRQAVALVRSNAIENWRVYHFHDTSENAPLRSSSPMTEPERLAADGANLPAFLYFLQEAHPDTFIILLDTIRQAAPFIGALILRPEALNKDLIRLRWRHAGQDQLFDVSDLSDGTLRFIALAALLLQPDPPSTIILDEPELGLHPAAIAQLAALMRQVPPRAQIIAATQSPTLANQFEWADFIIADRVDGATRLRRLEQSEVAPWMDDFAMGDIWEKNLIGGRP